MMSNGHDGISNYQSISVCSAVCSDWQQRNIMSALLYICEGNPVITGGFPTQRDRNTENVPIWWHHNEELIKTSHNSSSWECYGVSLVGSLIWPHEILGVHYITDIYMGFIPICFYVSCHICMHWCWCLYVCIVHFRWVLMDDHYHVMRYACITQSSF